MPRYLMDFCLNNRKEICNEKVKYSRWPRLINSPEDIPPFPIGKAQDELDEICENCAHALFIVDKCCPLCSGHKLDLADPKKVVLNSDLGAINVYHYICSKCGIGLYSRNAPPS